MKNAINAQYASYEEAYLAYKHQRISKEEFMDLLVNDLTRDFLTRGQTWFYLKKLNYKKMYNGNPVWWDVPDEWYVLPIPDSETMY